MIGLMTSALERFGRRDIAIATVFSVLGMLLMYGNVRDPEEGAVIHVGNLLPLEFAIPLFLLVTVPLLWRRVAPLAAAAAAFAGLIVNVALLGTELIRCGVAMPTAGLLAYTAGAQLELREARAGLAFALGLVTVDYVVGFGPVVAAVFGAVIVAVWSVGRIAHSRRLLADELRERNTELREARDERARPSDAATATATLVDIEHASRRTLEEMRAVVGVLRDDSVDAPTAPQPTLTHLEALLIGAKGAGARLNVAGSPRALPATVELSAYRVVEHLLAALQDAPDVEVRVRFGDDALELAVSGPARRSAKAAIKRARERARLHRGTVEATVHGGRAEVVAAADALGELRCE